MKNILLVLVTFFVFTACTSSSSNVKKVFEEDYPEGISVAVLNEDLNEAIQITDARLVNGSVKKQLQLILQNTSSSKLNIKLIPEWTDRRGLILKNNFRYKSLRLNEKSSARVVLNAPNFKAKDVFLNIQCNSNCIKD